jgi:RNA polymerase sigma factor (sigma-70 family)
MNSPQEHVDWTALAALVKAGDTNAVEDLAEKSGVLARKFYYRAGLSHEDAEDLAQESCKRIIIKLRQFDGRNFNGWALAILGNLLKEHYRRRGRRVPTVPLLDNDFELTIPETAHNGLLTETEHLALEEALARLEPDERTLIESQTGFQKVPFEQMGRELGISTDSARVRHHRAKEKLEICLRHDLRMKSWLARHQARQILNPEPIRPQPSYENPIK